MLCDPRLFLKYLSQAWENLRQPAQRKRKGLTQEEVARQIGTSAPQVSRTEHRPEHANVQTLMRYAEAVGMTLDMKLIMDSKI